ncbi:YcfL family protein [Avibacterium sp. 20-15]|uniref:YcfL family protein n=1 Tax=unclassified Avibacterium TaxID=2685287 RepID=UPI0020275E03|nr:MULTISPECIES: YcfL family protein [unclassified Avibacterium]MCW9733425.1 YcfL family protein [Avibacterium sp. 20-15]URL03296.1 YcfL family protein [Avibacterium sp. 20-132]
MKKLFVLCGLSLLLAACGSTPSQNIVSENDPILNVEANLAPLIETKLRDNNVWLKNTSPHQLDVAYYFFWYDKNGVTQGEEPNLHSPSSLLLQPNQQTNLTPVPPTQQSVNYRLYLRLNKLQ